MRKITLLFILITSFTFGQVVLTEDFGTDPIPAIPSGWTNNEIIPSGNIWAFEGTGQTPAAFTTPNTILYTNAGHSGNYAVFNSDGYGGGPEETALESPAFSCAGLTVVKLSFNHFYLTGYGGEAYVEVYDGSSWIVVTAYTEAIIGADPGYDFGPVVVDVSTELAGVTNAQVRFRWTGDYAWFWTIDDVTVQQPSVSAPDPATTPSPADMATNEPLVQDDVVNYPNKIYFSWMDAVTGDAPTSYSLVLGTTSPPSQTFNNFTNGDFIFNMSYGTTYYWQVISENIGGSTASDIWEFTTQADPLSLEDQVLDTFSVYPNPVKDYLNIDTSLTIESIALTNMLGKQVLMINGSSISNNRIDLSNFSNGLYILQVNALEKSQSFKIIKE